ncbi:mycothiol transferase [Kitasatospora sp. NPDC001683]
MTSTDLLVDAFDRIRDTVAEVVDGLTPEQLAFRVQDSANSIAWLVWHLTRVQDDHLADAAGREQVWTADGWAGRFALPFAVSSTGYGHRPAQVAKVTATADLLVGYHEAVHAGTVDYVRGLNNRSLGRIVDESWQPPVTLGVRLISVIADDLQHVGQAAYVRGLLARR